MTDITPPTDQPTDPIEGGIGEGGEIEQKVNDALDKIEQGVADLRNIIDAEPVRGLVADVKEALDSFVGSVEEALAKVRDVIEPEAG